MINGVFVARRQHSATETESTQIDVGAVQTAVARPGNLSSTSVTRYRHVQHRTVACNERLNLYSHIHTHTASGRSGLAVACLTAVREVPGSNRAVGSCVYRKNHCDLPPWARAVCTFPAVPRSTQPSTLRGTVNEYQLSG